MRNQRIIAPNIIFDLLKRLLAFKIVFLLLSIFCGSLATANTELSKESKLKAAYLLNFTLFMTWPEQTSQAASSSPQRINVCVQANENFFEFASALSKGAKFSTSRKQIHIVKFTQSADCQMTYIQQDASVFLQRILNNVLVVDNATLNTEQAAIKFFTDKRKLRFEINLPALRRSDVTVSSELLKLAKVNRDVN